MPLLALLLILAGRAFEHQIECGDPTAESMSWRVLTGAVEAVEPNGDLRLISVVEWDQRTFPRTVHLAGVELSPFAQPVLQKLVGKKVTVWINPKAIDNARVSGVVYRGEQDINRMLLSRGLGRWDDPPAYTMSDYVRCLHRISEREARDARRGLWASSR